MFHQLMAVAIATLEKSKSISGTVRILLVKPLKRGCQSAFELKIKEDIQLELIEDQKS